jgi:hypothetical protein
MENQTRFDLNAAIENWRQELAAQPNLASDDRRELEMHLRDAIAGFQQRGLNDEESFWLARRRVGQLPQLGEEFIKADPAKVWRERLFWMWLALFLSATLGNVANSLAFAVMPTEAQLRSSLAWQIMPIGLGLLSMLIPLVLVILLANGKLIPQFSKLMPFVRNRRRLAITAFVCFALSSAVRFGALAIFSRNNHLSTAAWIGEPSVSAFYALFLGLILVWLMPAQSRKTPKRA